MILSRVLLNCNIRIDPLSNVGNMKIVLMMGEKAN